MTQAFNLSQLANKVNSSGLLDVATGVTGTQAVANGGTGQTTYTDGQLLIGNTTGNTLTKATITAGSGITVTNGSGAITIAASGGGSLQTEVFTAPGTWTKPASATQVRVAVIGGGGGGGNPGFGAQQGSGGTSSFGPAVSATGGTGGTGPNTNGTAGSGTVSVGTALRTSNVGRSDAPTGAGYTQDPQHFITSGAGFNTGGVTPYSTSAIFQAGASGGSSSLGKGGGGGFGLAIVPVTAPVSITIGAGGPTSGPSGGVGGAIVVEYVG